MRLIPLTAALFGLALAVQPAPAAAQEGEPAGEPRAEAAAGLPVSLERIQRGLRQATVAEEGDGLNLRYQIEVFGQAPPLIVFTPEDNLRFGPVRFAAPTHREMIEHVTPREYRAPAADFSALLRWLLERRGE